GAHDTLVALRVGGSSTVLDGSAVDDRRALRAAAAAGGDRNDVESEVARRAGRIERSGASLRGDTMVDWRARRARSGGVAVDEKSRGARGAVVGGRPAARYAGGVARRRRGSRVRGAHEAAEQQCRQESAELTVGHVRSFVVFRRCAVLLAPSWSFVEPLRPSTAPADSRRRAPSTPTLAYPH